MIKGLKRRFANFGFLVGGAMLALFFTADSTNPPDVKLLFYGLFLVIFGWKLGKKEKSEPVESNRFRTLRRLKRREGLFPKPSSEDETIHPED